MLEGSAYLPQAAVAELRRIDPWRSLGSLAWTWGFIAASFALWVRYPTWWSLCAVWLVMSGRHLALAILMHEAAHGLLLRNKLWNDRLGQWLTAYPAMVDMFLYRKTHFLHHRNTWTERDPDLGLATALPVTRRSFRRKLIRDLTGQTAWTRHRIIVRYASGLKPQGHGLSGKSPWSALRSFVRAQRGFLFIHALMLGALVLVGRPDAYLVVWWLPALTGYSVVLRLRSIAEHACVSDPTDPLRQTRTTLAPGWLRFFLAPHHVGYHLEHHLFMTVPHYNLPRAHRQLKEAGVLDNAEIAPSYAQVLARATSLPEPAVS